MSASRLPLRPFAIVATLIGALSGCGGGSDNTSASDMQAALNAAAGVRSNTGWVYATDQRYDYATNTGNPWAALPAYWEQMLSTVNAINKDSALPGC